MICRTVDRARGPVWLLAVLLGVTGCSQPSQEVQPGSSTTSTAASTAVTAAPDASGVVELPSAQQRRKIDAYLADVAQAYGLEDLPKVETIRMVPQAEREQVHADCMREAGFPMDAEFPPEQAQALALATYTCIAQYPGNPDQDLSTVSEQQKLDVYAHLTQDLIPCLAREGHQISGVPSEQAFIDQWEHAGPWNPYDQIAPGLSRSDYEALNQKCPMNTLADQLWDQ